MNKQTNDVNRTERHVSSIITFFSNNKLLNKPGNKFAKIINRTKNLKKFVLFFNLVRIIQDCFNFIKYKVNSKILFYRSNCFLQLTLFYERLISVYIYR